MYCIALEFTEHSIILAQGHFIICYLWKIGFWTADTIRWPYIDSILGQRLDGQATAAKALMIRFIRR